MRHVNFVVKEHTSQGRFSNIGSNNDLSGVILGFLENLGLQVCW
jgi:hypothetical protein